LYAPAFSLHKTRGSECGGGEREAVCLLYYEIRMGKRQKRMSRELTIKGIINYKTKFARNNLPQEYESVYAGR
jgi:hypothetical protein